MAIIPLQQNLKIESYILNASENKQTTYSVSGQSHSVVRGPRLWQGKINCPASSHAKARETEGILNGLMLLGNSFVFTPFDAKGQLKPASYQPTHNLSNIRVNGLQAVGYSLRLRGLPASYQLTAGDMLSFVINSTHRLFSLTESVTANAAGEATVKLNIGLDQGSLPADGSVVTMDGPRVTCRYVNNSFSGINLNPAYAEGFSFSFQQTLFL